MALRHFSKSGVFQFTSATTPRVLLCTLKTSCHSGAGREHKHHRINGVRQPCPALILPPLLCTASPARSRIQGCRFFCTQPDSGVSHDSRLTLRVAACADIELARGSHCNVSGFSSGLNRQQLMFRMLGKGRPTSLLWAHAAVVIAALGPAR
jgi:hypothetical protein